MRKKSNRNLAEIVAVLAVLCVLPILLLAEEYNFRGTWRGSLAQGTTPAAPGVPAGTVPGGSIATKSVDDGEYGVGCSSGCGPIILRVASVNKEKGTAKGKFTAGAVTEDIRDGKVMGNKLTFKTGQAPAQIFDYEASQNGEYLTLTWTPESSRGSPRTFTLRRNK